MRGAPSLPLPSPPLPSRDSAPPWVDFDPKKAKCDGGGEPVVKSQVASNALAQAEKGKRKGKRKGKKRGGRDAPQAEEEEKEEDADPPGQRECQKQHEEEDAFAMEQDAFAMLQGMAAPQVRAFSNVEEEDAFAMMHDAFAMLQGMAAPQVRAISNVEDALRQATDELDSSSEALKAAMVCLDHAQGADEETALHAMDLAMQHAVQA